MHNNEHLLQSDLLSNHIEKGSSLCVYPQSYKIYKATLTKKTNPEKLLTKDFTSSHTISKQR